MLAKTAKTVLLDCGRDANGIGHAGTSGLGQRTVEPRPKIGGRRFVFMDFSETAARFALFCDTLLPGSATPGEALKKIQKTVDKFARLRIYSSPVKKINARNQVIMNKLPNDARRRSQRCVYRNDFDSFSPNPNPLTY